MIDLPSLFEICEPRRDVLAGRITESDFAADLAQVLRGDAPDEYKDPAKFFANTHPTRGLKTLLRNVCLRLTGNPEQVAAIFRLDTNYGGGKTHALIALTHAVRGLRAVPSPGEFIDPALLPTELVRIAAFDGENADPYNGRALGDGLKAYTPWGELAYALAGHDGYEQVRQSDEKRIAPGSATLRELFGDEPTLILLDELSVYLRKAWAEDRTAGKHAAHQAGDQTTAFLTALFKAVESSPRAVVVYTLAIGKGGIATDAYSAENRFIAEKMEEYDSVSARKAALLDPTEEDETVKVLRRRLFARIDDNRAAPIIDAYRQSWEQYRELLPAGLNFTQQLEAFRAGFPLHPALIETLKEKTSTLLTFQRVRGMLRLLARTVHRLWQQRPPDACAIHLHHIDPGFEPIRQELVTRLNQSAFVPVIKADVAAVPGDQLALAQELDQQHYIGLPPHGSYVARTILLHTLAFHEDLKGIQRDPLRFTILSPRTDISFIDDAIRRFTQASFYLDDRASAPLRFMTEPNLVMLIRREEQRVRQNQDEIRSQLNDRIRQLFKGSSLICLPFAAGPYEIPDDDGEGRPYLIVLGYDAVEVRSDAVAVPDLVARMYQYKSANDDQFRQHRNNLVFLAIDAANRSDIWGKMAYRLALGNLRQPERRKDLTAPQQERLEGLYQQSEQALAVAIQQAYRHLFYPSKLRLEGAMLDLAHSVVDLPSASANPGDGQRQVVRVLQDNNKLRLPDDEPDSPTYIRDRTLLRKGRISTAALRAEFRRDPGLPMLVGDAVFVRGIRRGVEQGEYVYQYGDLLWGKGDPWAEIKIDEQAFVYTAGHAREQGIWPRSARKPKPDSEPPDIVYPSPPAIAPEPTKVNDPPTTDFIAEGVLKEALTRLWGQLRAREVAAIKTLELRVYHVTDGLRLLGLIAAIPRADKQLTLVASYTTTQGSEFRSEFSGAVADAQPIKDFLEPQLRAARERTLTATYLLTFNDGLSLAGDEPEKLTGQLSKGCSSEIYARTQGEEAV